MKFMELFRSKCEKDYKSKHYWESIGCVGLRPIYRVWHCTQCDKCITEEVDMLVKVNTKNSKKENKEMI